MEKLVTIKRFVLPLKADRKVALSLEEKRRDQYVAVNTLEAPAGAHRQVWLEEVDFRLPLDKQVFTNENSSAGISCLVTDDLEFD